MWSETQEFPSPEQPVVSQPSTQPLVDQVVKPISYLVDSTLLLESDPDVIEPMSYLVNPTLPLETKVSASHIFFTASPELVEQGGTELASDHPPPSSRIASFD